MLDDYYCTPSSLCLGLCLQSFQYTHTFLLYINDGAASDAGNYRTTSALPKLSYIVGGTLQDFKLSRSNCEVRLTGESRRLMTTFDRPSKGEVDHMKVAALLRMGPPSCSLRWSLGIGPHTLRAPMPLLRASERHIGSSYHPLETSMGLVHGELSSTVVSTSESSGSTARS